MTEKQSSKGGTSDLNPLQVANIKRGTIKGQLTRFKSYLDELANIDLNNIEISKLTLKLNKFETLQCKFYELQTEIELLNYDNLAYEMEQREGIEEDFIIAMATAKSFIEKYNEANTRRSSQCSHSQPEQEIGIRLPQIQIAKFDGSYFRWLEFRDTFQGLIHDNDKISPIQKFYYLNSYLEGEASRVVSNLDISSENYSLAWVLLNDRYNNDRVLVDQHLNSLYNIQPMNRESERSLRYLVDHVTKNLRALHSLGLPTDKWDTMIIFLLSKKLDSRTLIKWEEHRSSLSSLPSITDFNDFLIDRANVLQALYRNKVPSQSSQNESREQASSRGNFNNPNNKVSKQHSLTSTEQTSSFIKKCVFCNEDHRIYDCEKFKSKSLSERKSEVNKLKLCHNCLRPGHVVKNCVLGPCRLCKKRHNTLLHPESEPQVQASQAISETEQIATFAKERSTSVLLSTALIKVTNPNTKESTTVRALLDSGSQSSFVSQSLRQQLSLQSNKIDTINIIGIGNNHAKSVQERCIIQIGSLCKPYQVTMSCLVLAELTGELPRAPIDISQLQLPTDIQLADPKFYEPAPIDVLIGADLFWDILKGEQRSLGLNKPKLQNSQLGWLVAGPIATGLQPRGQRSFNATSIQCNHATITNSNEFPVDEFLPKFWELEEVPPRVILSESDKLCETHFLTHTTRNSEGRFCVRLPLKESPDCLGESYRAAKRRFLSTEKRFSKNPILKSDYVSFINEYRELGHLSESPVWKPDPAYFLCHHAVFKSDSESTKTRVVFDGSNPTTSGYSLNDLLMVGPNVQDSLFSILIRARQYKYILCGDIEKMYRQVEVHEDDRNLQLILWREDESRPIKTLKLHTLTYGTASASYLSTRCLRQVGEECNDETIKTIIQKDFYVDDLITGANNEEELRYIKGSVTSALRRACFNLRKFKSNLPTIFESNDVNTQQTLVISESANTLGLGWNPTSDKFHFPIALSSQNELVTKRLIMSTAFRIFDPLGLLSPTVIQPKMLLQELWAQKLDWDQPVPVNLKKSWLEFAENIHFLSELEIPRHVVIDNPSDIEVHSFSDASQRAYGACIYIRSRDSENNVYIRLLCAKSKVASLKPVTIPRLELCAALLAARLCNSVLNSIRFQPNRVYYWCDSSVVLGWLKANPTKLKTFVANRVCEINELTDSSTWRYVPTAQNPADLISRGVNPSQLQDLNLWWSGPSFLLKDESDWPVLKGNNSETSFNMDPELKVHVLPSVTPPPDNIINFHDFSSFIKLQRSFAYVLRFIFNLKHRTSKRTGRLTSEELHNSFNQLCSIAQTQSFPEEYTALARRKPLHHKSKLLSLSPFLKNNLIRVGGRISESSYSYNKKHPILLDSAHWFTKLLFIYEHNRNLHAGAQLLLATVREYVWPVNGRRLARNTVHNCVRCRRFLAKPIIPMMGNLPKQRITPDFPFLSVGVDFAGPFLILNRKGRGAKLIKAYLCLFVCLRYKCIHLEAVSDLSKDAFIMALRRFISRRGRPAEVFCDNGRNFVATCKELSNFIKLNNVDLSDFAAQESIQFKFIPAYAPHFGGIWEAGVKSAKYHLKRAMGNSHLTYEELGTLFTQVEAILNSRPLFPLSNSPDDFLFLSPGHFLVGRPLTALPAPPVEHRSETSLTRYARLEKIKQSFWKTWQKVFISELQQRKKWKRAASTDELKIDDLVLLQDDNVPPLCWRLGRVHKLFPGPDGITRVADIVTARGCIRRPLVRLCPLLPDQTRS